MTNVGLSASAWSIGELILWTEFRSTRSIVFAQAPGRAFAPSSPREVAHRAAADARLP
jgi:hypothetical protein